MKRSLLTLLLLPLLWDDNDEPCKGAPRDPCRKPSDCNLQSHILNGGGEKLEFVCQRGSPRSVELSLPLAGDFAPCGPAATQQS